jgi:hypothetical protein
LEKDRAVHRASFLTFYFENISMGRGRREVRGNTEGVICSKKTTNIRFKNFLSFSC